ncbi:site-2 protease family protein [uncultured Nocardioides sp.]|uniref:site-2 protease family protein n=1 Tax=uncultured Nocardioides sp. TaxID=198441 RepID=UPI002602CC02|nr:site-2 protease family protein [uncultured Nocardioides sp.]
MPENRAHPRGTIRLGRVAGSDVLVSGSWFLVAALIAVLVAPRAELVAPGLGPWAYVVGFGFAVLLYGSVLLHEASHAVVARLFGFRVSAITLHFLGGMTAIEGEARRPRQEFWIAVVGPLTSLGVGLVALAALPVTPDGIPRLAVEALAGANLLVGVLNLVPGLPLDGGRVLKSAVWTVSGDQHRATLVAGWGGRVVALLVLLWPVALELGFRRTPQLIDYAIAFIVAVFLWTGAGASITSARVRSRLPGLAARSLARRSLTVPANTPVAEAVRRAHAAEAGGIVTLDAHGVPTGLVNEAALAAVPEDRRPWLPVSSVTRTLSDRIALAADLTGEDLVAALGRSPAPEYLVVEPDGHLHGVLVTADVERAFRRLDRRSGRDPGRTTDATSPARATTTGH